jgi:hypothetical protein
MDLKFAILVLSLVFAPAPTDLAAAELNNSHELELWLASGPECNSCEIFAELSQRRGYAREVRYERGADTVVVPIERVDKSTLPVNVLNQLSGDSGPSSRHWPIQLTVLVVRNGTVLSFGNIADSADLRTAKIAEVRMKPPARPTPDHPALSDTTDYRSYFLDHWNLEYFVSIALGDRSKTEARFIDLDASPAPQVGTTNVILWGAGGIPLKNGLFISQRIQEVRAVLERELADRNPRFITLYGRGPSGDSNDTSVRRNGAVSFFHPQFPIDYAADLAGVSSVFSALKRAHGKHSLLVHVGHSGPNGIPIWGMLGTFTPEDLSRISATRQSELIMISGGCHSGVFARAVQCGFFAAHPEVVSTGCQLSQEAVGRSDDYLRWFFASISQHRATGENVSLERAHWDASVRLEQHQISYTTVDALADAYFMANADALPQHMTVSDIRKLRPTATVSEAQALDVLTSDLDAQLSIALTDIVQRNHAAEKRLQGMTESSSERRNDALRLPYRLMLPSLTRRLIYRSRNSVDEDLQHATACEARSLATL